MIECVPSWDIWLLAGFIVLAVTLVVTLFRLDRERARADGHKEVSESLDRMYKSRGLRIEGLYGSLTKATETIEVERARSIELARLLEALQKVGIGIEWSPASTPKVARVPLRLFNGSGPSVWGVPAASVGMHGVPLKAARAPDSPFTHPIGLDS